MCRRNDNSSDEHIVEYLFSSIVGKVEEKNRVKYRHICLLVPLVMAKSLFDFQQIILGDSKTMFQRVKISSGAC